MMGIQPDGHGTVLFHFDIHFCPKFPGLQIPTKRNTQDLQELFIERYLSTPLAAKAASEVMDAVAEEV